MVIELSMKGVEEALRKLSPELYRKALIDYLNASVELVASLSSEHAPRRTGKLSSSIRASRKGELIFEVVSEAPYSLYLEKGVSSFTLNRPVMIDNIGWRFIKTHPGIKPIGFISGAVAIWRQTSNKLFQQILEKARPE